MSDDSLSDFIGEWDSEEEAAGIPIRFPGYTESEWAEIEAAVRAIRADGLLPSSVRLSVMLTTVYEIGYDPRISLEICSSLEDEMLQIYNTIKNLDDLLRPRIDEGDFCEGRWDRDPFGAYYEKARPFLVAAAHLAVKEGSRHADAFDRAKVAIMRSSNRKNWFRKSFFHRVARRWETFGGVVRQSREYRRFFEAVVRPMYYSDFGKRHGLDGWPDAVWPDGNPIFREHARAYMRMRGTKPSRGPASAETSDRSPGDPPKST
ncbi:hypothetical protein [Salinarimonas chemoclinalis]|uniref:hypothetical protein n=1 Tax=Salinarimonas chemoclinalis TaxID=3241599 RepID=UPI003555D4C0